MTGENYSQIYLLVKIEDDHDTNFDPYRSFQELTPVEFACETMENVAKELYELIDQYRADPKRNINPFSMRLQGIIDANVMGEQKTQIRLSFKQ